MSSNAVSAHQGIRVSLEELIALRDDAQQLLWRTSSKRCSTQHGLKQSKHQGRGIDFADTRVYQAGDDIRHIDWHATLRTDQVHTKLYHEEKERPIWLLVDHNPTMFFATLYAFKSVVAARAAALCAWAFAAQGERVGGLVFSGKRQLSVPPKDRLHAVLPLLKQLADSSEQAASPVDNHSLDHAFDFLLQRHLHGNLILIFSDFWQWQPHLATRLQPLARKNQCIAILVQDPLERMLPHAGYYPVSDGHKTHTLNTYDPNLKKRYQQLINDREQYLQRTLRHLNMTTLSLWTTEAELPQLKPLFM